jgi:hypothetical protein
MLLAHVLLVCSAPVVLEVGCGAGSNIFPLLEQFPTMFAWALDYSASGLKVTNTPASPSVRLSAHWIRILIDALHMSVTVRACFAVCAACF